MAWHRFLLSMVLIGGCVWCVGQVRQAHSQQQSTLGPSASHDQRVRTTDAIAARSPFPQVTAKIDQPASDYR